MTSATREHELRGEGWVKRTTYDEPRLSEISEMYRELGYEVHLEPFVPDEESDCTECMRSQPEKYMTVYTRTPTDRPDAG